MTITDLKQEIKKAIDEVPESVLIDILEYLKQVKKSSTDKVNLSKQIGFIIRQDKELLERLAL